MYSWISALSRRRVRKVTARAVLRFELKVFADLHSTKSWARGSARGRFDVSVRPDMDLISDLARLGQLRAGRGHVRRGPVGGCRQLRRAGRGHVGRSCTGAGLGRRSFTLTELCWRWAGGCSFTLQPPAPNAGDGRDLARGARAVRWRQPHRPADLRSRDAASVDPAAVPTMGR